MTTPAYSENGVDSRLSAAWSAPLAWAVGALCVTALVFAAQTPNVLGLFHDDGIYVATATSIAERGAYAIGSLPDEPSQTKYPPAYTVLLAVVWSLAPQFPDNIPWLKAINVVLVGVMLFGYGYLTRQALPHASLATTLLLIVLLGTTPGVVSFADFTMSDILFVCIVVWYLVAASWAAETGAWRRHVVLAALIAVSILSRSVGICLVIATALDQLRLRDYRRAAFHVAVGTATFAVWSGWAASASDPLHPIVSYYQIYETSALGYLSSDPGLAARIVLGNLRLAVDGARLVVGPTFWLWPALLALAVVGIGDAWRRGQYTALLFTCVYFGVVLVHPFAPHRYLLPLLPLFYLAVANGLRSLAMRFESGGAGSTAAMPFSQAVVLGVCTLMLVGNVAWVHLVLSPASNGHVRGWYGVDFGYRWDGFEETFAWIRSNTNPEDRLGTIYDPMYYLYTGRQAVRPWFHYPETYFYPPDKPVAFVGRPREVAGQLRSLGVTYLVLDPPTGYAEGEAATKLLRQILMLPEVASSREFTSRDGRHEVHRLEWSSSGLTQ